TIARNDAVTVVLDGTEQTLPCATARQKSEAFRRIYWSLRELPDEDDIHRYIDALAARYGVDMAPLRDELCMTWDEIRELAADPPATIGAHTVNHVMLAKASDAAARDELKVGREAVEAKLGRPVLHLAYPYGGRDLVRPREFRLAAEIGYKTAVTTRPGVL